MASQYMARALTLARRGMGSASPNPMVGAVIVGDNGRIIAEGYHKAAGTAHAEVAALAKAGENARGQTLYVTLEPCNHHGHTPPCTEAIINAGIRRVVVAVSDPNPWVQGGGIQRLKGAGITVEVGDGLSEAQKLNSAFFTWCREHRPWITLKAAMSLDGKVAAYTGESKYLTSPSALAHAHELRREHDAILVGSATVLADNPRLTYRGKRRGKNPVRIVLDSRGRVPSDALIFDPAADTPTLVFTTEETPMEWERDIFSAGGEVIRVSRDPNGHVALKEVMEHLAERRILSVLVEGGPTIHAAFLAQGLADRWVGYLAPLILGGQEAPSAVGGMGFSLMSAPRFKMEKVARRGPDIIIDARRQTDGASPTGQEEVQDCLPVSLKP